MVGADERRLSDWLQAVVETPGLTSLSLADARRMLLEDSLRAVDLVRAHAGPVVDVGSGGGAPGIPLAYALHDREVVLLEAGAAEVRLPRAVGAAERARRLGPRRGAADRLGGRRPGEGACHPAGRGRVVPAARATRRDRDSLGRRPAPNSRTPRALRPAQAAAARGSPSSLPFRRRQLREDRSVPWTMALQASPALRPICVRPDGRPS